MQARADNLLAVHISHRLGLTLLRAPLESQQRPRGGAFVSMNPGDRRARSPSANVKRAVISAAHLTNDVCRHLDDAVRGSRQAALRMVDVDLDRGSPRARFARRRALLAALDRKHASTVSTSRLRP